MSFRPTLQVTLLLALLSGLRSCPGSRLITRSDSLEMARSQRSTPLISLVHPDGHGADRQLRATASISKPVHDRGA